MAIVGISLVEYRKHEKKTQQGKSNSIVVFGSIMRVSCYLLTLLHSLLLTSMNQPYLVDVFSSYGLVRKSPNNKET